MEEAIDKLRNLPAGHLSEVCEKHTFECYRVQSDGCMQEVTVVILDAGPNVQQSPRYFVHATSAEGRTVAGRADSSLDAVLASIKWSDLDPVGSADTTAAAAASDVPGSPDTLTRDYDRRDLFEKIRKRLAST